MVESFYVFWTLVLVVFPLAIYIYNSLALMTIAKKLNHSHPWMAWIPFANIALILQLGNFHWAWTFLVLINLFNLIPFPWTWMFLIPLLGGIPLVVLLIISTWRIYKARNYPEWLSLITALSLLILLSVLALLSFSPFLLMIPYIMPIGLLATSTYLIILGLVAWKDQQSKPAVRELFRAKE